MTRRRIPRYACATLSDGSSVWVDQDARVDDLERSANGSYLPIIRITSRNDNALREPAEQMQFDLRLR